MKTIMENFKYYEKNLSILSIKYFMKYDGVYCKCSWVKTMKTIMIMGIHFSIHGFSLIMNISW